MTKIQVEQALESVQGKPESKEQAALYVAALQGFWALDVVMPILRKLHPSTEVNFKLDGAKVVSTPDKRQLKDVLEAAFKLCPQTIKANEKA